ncbi:MAG: hypothetical protein AAF658_04995 [Myxococcota bacterium]
MRRLDSIARAALTLSATIALASCSEDTLRSLQTTTEQFNQNSSAQIDVLWVVDNSDSMGQEQSGLGQSFQSFIETLIATEVDYRIGVTSTDPADGGLLQSGPSNVPFISATTPNAANVFLENVSLGTNGSPVERGFETMSLALGVGPTWVPGTAANPPNPGFLRDEASLFIIMVSDEDDESFGPVGYYQRLVETYKGIGNEALISVSAIASPAGVEPCFEPTRGTANASGERYDELVGLTGGTFASICSDFGEALSRLSSSAAGLDSVFELAGAPQTTGQVDCPGVAATAFCVRVQEVGASEAVTIPESTLAGWTYDPERNAIIFGVDAIPGANANITVEYVRATTAPTASTVGAPQ